MRLDLRHVPTHVLTEALARIEKGQAQPPWSTSFALALPAAASALAPIDVASSEVVAALLAVVVEERRARTPAAEIVWTGPEPFAASSRDTAAVVAGMFRDAEREVLVSVYALDVARDPAHALFAPLHATMSSRAVTASIFFDVERCADVAHVSRAEAATGAPFLSLYWPWGPPFPQLFFDPRSLEQGPPSSMHAKMVVTDRRFVLVGSANLTDRGHTRNVELGVRIEDPMLGERLAAQWLGAAENGGFRRCGQV
jgi:PLD-like domain